MSGGFDYDLFVIGAGSGGVRAARIAAGHGARVAIAEESRVGGTCVIRGCVPKKLLVYASHFADAFEDAAGFGWTVGDTRFDWTALIAAKDREIDRLNLAYIANLERAGAEIIHERAVLQDAHTIRLLASDRTVTARIVLVATGARPHRPDMPGAPLAITSDEAFHLDRLPERIVIVGGGYIAVEFAGIFNGLGSEVTLVHRGERILRGFDHGLQEGLAAAMAARGITLSLRTLPTGLEAAGDSRRVVLSDGRTVEADVVMFATGRQPHVHGLGLERAGVALDNRGAVQVDAFSRTSVETIYAVGDVTNRVNLTPVAIREGDAFADTVFGGAPMSVDHSLVPTAVFSQPELGTVGLTEAEAVARHPAVDIYETSFRPMRNTLSGRDERMMMKVLVDADDDRVLGVHLLGEGMGEVIQAIGIALRMGARKTDFDRTMAVHPTASEELVTLRSPNRQHRRAAA